MTRHWSFALMGVALIGAFVFIAWGEWIAARVHEEVFKVLAQLVLLAALGGVPASLVIDALNRGRERREQIKERLRNTLSDSMASVQRGQKRSSPLASRSDSSEFRRPGGSS